MVRLVCPGCAKTLQVNDTLSGRQIYCPRCRHVIRVPVAAAAAADQATLPPAAPAADAATLPPAPAQDAETLPPPAAGHEAATLPPLASFTDAPAAALPPGAGAAAEAPSPGRRVMTSCLNWAAAAWAWCTRPGRRRCGASWR
jgi:hypothetical protein